MCQTNADSQSRRLWASTAAGPPQPQMRALAAWGTQAQPATECRSLHRSFNLNVVHCPIIHPPASVRRSPPRGPRLSWGLKGPARAARRTQFRQWHSTRDRGRGTSKMRLPSLTRSLPSSTRWALLAVSSGQVKMAAHWDWRLPPLQDRDPPQRRSKVAVSSTSPHGDHRARPGPHSMRLLAAS